MIRRTWPARTPPDLAPQAIQNHQEIALDAVDDCVVNGDATLLAVLVRNLVDNAIRYSPARASVQIAINGNVDVLSAFAGYNAGPETFSFSGTFAGAIGATAGAFYV